MTYFLFTYHALIQFIFCTNQMYLFIYGIWFGLESDKLLLAPLHNVGLPHSTFLSSVL